MKIAIIGTGYVGLVSGACFADVGHVVTCIDKNPEIVLRLEKGEVPIYEPGLEEVVARNVAAGRLSFSGRPTESIPDADVVFFAVGTPPGEGGEADLSFVRAAAREIAPALSGYTVVVTKSTVPVGTGRQVYKIIRETAPKADFDIASVPEFLREGSAVADFMNPDRIVAGTESERAANLLRELHAPLIAGRPDRFVATGVETAELVKYGANAFLAVKITFINEIADLCESVGADIEEVARGMGLDTRIGRWGLSAGPGYGGSCFPKDTLALARTASKAHSPARLVEMAIEVNDKRKASLARRVADAVGGSLAGKTVALLGITFKANTDDVRDSPAVDLAEAMREQGANIRAFDPKGMSHAKTLLQGVEWCVDSVGAAKGADAAVIATEWGEFKPGSLNLERLKSVMARPLLVDFRNLHEPAEVAKQGFTYVSVGRKTAYPENA
jgi:UDPglucose 6-dehydrogenase